MFETTESTVIYRDLALMQTELKPDPRPLLATARDQSSAGNSSHAV